MPRFPPPIDPSYVPSVSLIKIPATVPTSDIIATLKRDVALTLTDLVSSQDIAAFNAELEAHIQKAKAETHAAHDLAPNQMMIVPGVVGKSPTMVKIAEFEEIDKLRILVFKESALQHRRSR